MGQCAKPFAQQMAWNSTKRNRTERRKKSLTKTNQKKGRNRRKRSNRRTTRRRTRNQRITWVILSRLRLRRKHWRNLSRGTRYKCKSIRKVTSTKAGGVGRH